MPNNFFSVDSRFPNIANKTQEQINGEVINYLFLLLEQLRYTMGNLGVSNFNEAELDGIAGMISDPIYVRLEDAEGNVNAVQVTAEGLTQQVSDLSGNVETLTITAEGLVNRVSDAEGNISTLTQTTDGLSTRVSDAEGNVNALTQSSQAFDLRLTNAEGSVASLNLTATNLSAEVGDHSLAINNLGIQMQGKVSFVNLSQPGQTIIDAGNITTGTLNAIKLQSCIFENNDIYGNVLQIAGGNITWYRQIDQLIVGRIFFDAFQNLTFNTLGDINISSSKGYSFLHTANINTYISANAATIRALLGL